MSCGCNNSTSLPIGLTGSTGTPGTDGIDGTNGTNGVSLLYNNISNVSTTDGAAGLFESLQIYTLPANTLITNGDSLELMSSLSVDVTTSIAYVELYFNGASVVPTPPANFRLYPGTKYCLFRATISRQTNTTVFIQFDVELSGGPHYTNTGSYQFHVLNVPVNSLTGTTNTIAIFGAETPAVNTLTAHNLMITKYVI